MACWQPAIKRPKPSRPRFPDIDFVPELGGGPENDNPARFDCDDFLGSPRIATRPGSLAADHECREAVHLHNLTVDQRIADLLQDFVEQVLGILSGQRCKRVDALHNGRQAGAGDGCHGGTRIISGGRTCPQW